MIERTDLPRTAAPRVVLVDDHTLLRQGLRQALQEHGIDVIGEASNGRAGAQLVLELRPDVTVMDLHMPLLDGLGALREIVDRDPGARVLMFTISTDADEVVEALTAGAAGYVLKSARPEDVVAAVRTVIEGDSVISPKVASRLVERVRTSARPPATSTHTPLTTRELEILRLIADGRENSDIARTLFISPSTAKNHVAKVLEKLGVENRVQAAVYAVRSGLV